MLRSSSRRPEVRTVTKKPMSRSLRMYERIAVGFVVATIVLLLAVLYLSVSRATIKVYAAPKTVSATATADVAPAATGDVLAGVVKKTTVERSKTFTLPSDGATPVDAKAEGFVTLKNETGSAQPLVATTRVLSEGGVLFRLVEPTTVPARGEVRVKVAADQPGKAGEIGPSKFTIPGLNATLQQSIYGVSDAAMVGGVRFVRLLSAEDIASASATLQDEVLESAKTTLSTGVDTNALSGSAYSVTVLSQQSDVAAGTETGAVTVSMKADVVGVFYDKNVVASYGEKHLEARVPKGFTLGDINADGLTAKIENVDAAAGTARLSFYVDGTARLTDTAEALKKSRFYGRSPSEVETLLAASEGVQKSEVHFTPFWLKRVPTLPDHISIVVVDAEEEKK